MTSSGISDVVESRAREAGIGHLNPHRIRHSFAHLWLVEGGQEQDLEQIAGWSRPTMAPPAPAAVPTPSCSMTEVQPMTARVYR
jgi:integrase